LIPRDGRTERRRPPTEGLDPKDKTEAVSKGEVNLDRRIRLGIIRRIPEDTEGLERETIRLTGSNTQGYDGLLYRKEEDEDLDRLILPLRSPSKLRGTRRLRAPE
jgi:hypothetical protein